MSARDYLGKTFRDRVTGFEGVCTGYHSWLTGCDGVTLQPSVDKDGKVPVHEVFDVTRLDPVAEVRVKVDTETSKGGPHDRPSPSNGQR